MKSKTSVTLSGSILAGVKKAARRGESRSETIERLLQERLDEAAAERTYAREVALINRHADAINHETSDVLEYQEDV
jgi:metal-responsive CopG/Arc/MetJ family transcriptional regulator